MLQEAIKGECWEDGGFGDELGVGATLVSLCTPLHDSLPQRPLHSRHLPVTYRNTPIFTLFMKIY